MSATLIYPTVDTKQTAMNDNLRNLDQPNHLCQLPPQNDTQCVDDLEVPISDASCIVFWTLTASRTQSPARW
jgi:hypothetical protein